MTAVLPAEPVNSRRFACTVLSLPSATDARNFHFVRLQTRIYNHPNDSYIQRLKRCLSVEHAEILIMTIAQDYISDIRAKPS